MIDFYDVHTVVYTGVASIYSTPIILVRYGVLCIPRTYNFLSNARKTAPKERRTYNENWRELLLNRENPPHFFSQWGHHVVIITVDL